MHSKYKMHKDSKYKKWYSNLQYSVILKTDHDWHIQGIDCKICTDELLFLTLKHIIIPYHMYTSEQVS